LVMGSACRHAPGLPPAWPVLAGLEHRQFAGPSFSRSLKAAVGQRRRQCRAVPGGDRGQAAPGRRQSGVALVGASGLSAVRVAGGGVQADCRQVGLLPVSLAPLHRRQFAGPSFSRSLKAAVGKRRRQCRAVPGGDRRQAGQDDGEAAHRQPIGVAVAGQGVGVRVCARLPPAWLELAALDHRQFFRAFVRSIAQGCRGATTAPVSSSAWW
jgi:hypothetical protein